MLNTFCALIMLLFLWVGFEIGRWILRKRVAGVLFIGILILLIGSLMEAVVSGAKDAIITSFPIGDRQLKI